MTTAIATAEAERLAQAALSGLPSQQDYGPDAAYLVSSTAVPTETIQEIAVALRSLAAENARLREAEADKARLGEDAVKLSTLLQEATARAEKAEAVCRLLTVWNAAVTREESGADEWPAVEDALEAWQATQGERQTDA